VALSVGAKPARQVVSAVLVPGLTLALSWFLWNFIEPHVWFLFYPAVFFSSLLGGRRIGLIAAALVSVLVWWLFLPPRGAIAVVPEQIFQVAVFFVTSTAIAFASERSTDATRALGAKKQLDADVRALTELHEVGSLFLSEGGHVEPVLARIVDAAIAVAEADFGNIQLLDPRTLDLQIVAQRGFSEEWLHYWSVVTAGRGTCGTALAHGERVIVEDIERSPVFVGTPALEVQRRQGVRAVQSTPLFTRSGVPVGMFSTHWRKPHRPDARTLRLLDLLARQSADIIELSQTNERRAEALADTQRSNEELRRVQGELQRTNDEVIEASNFLENLLQSSTEYSIIAKDLERRVVAWNSGAARIYGYRASEVVGRSSDMLHVAEELQSGLVAGLHRRALETGHSTGLFRRRPRTARSSSLVS
jgi:PAS domain-containing protein